MVVASAGNSAADFCPLYYNEDTTFDKILVGSTDRNDAASSFSNYGPCVHMQVFETPHPRAAAPAMSVRKRPPGLTRCRTVSPSAHVRRPQVRASWERG